MINFKTKISGDQYYRIRFFAVAFAVFLGLCSVLMGLSLLSALFGKNDFFVVPGILFTRSFGLLSLLIPVHLAYAAFILADPKWRPDRIFVLSACIFPFLTLVVGFSFTRDFENQAAHFSLLNFTGKTGFSLLIISITVVEVLLLQVLRNALFFKENAVVIRRKPNLLPPPANAAVNEDIASETELHVVDNVSADYSNTGEIKNSECFYKELDEENTEDEFDTDELPPAVVNIKPGNDNNAVARALEEAEAAAAAHGEQVRKKTKSGSSCKKYKIPVDILNEYPDGEYWIIDQATRDAAIAL
ncbi:MAG: hypothetical protein LBI12_00150, partial [Treponema sp.]|nr:hypothetical protein [Treponema sp.]